MPGPPVVSTTFRLGTGPMPDVASDPATHRAYITSQGDDSLYVVDATSRIATITVGPSPRFAAVDSTTQTAYVTTGDSVSVIDIASGSVTATIAVGTNPEGAEVDPDTRRLFIANAGDDSVSVVDTDSRTVTATIEVGSRPGKMGVDPTSHLLYVSNRGSATVSVVDPSLSSVIDTIAVSAIDSQKRVVTDTVGVGDGPQTVAADPATHTAWVVDFRANSISVIERQPGPKG
jgi:YVTN family beta-propeller protein